VAINVTGIAPQTGAKTVSTCKTDCQLLKVQLAMGPTGTLLDGQWRQLTDQSGRTTALSTKNCPVIPRIPHDSGGESPFFSQARLVDTMTRFSIHSIGRTKES